jgi:hypothetical protein
MLTCHEATRMLSEAQERPLQLAERAKLRMHLVVCRFCREFASQVDFLRSATRAYLRPDEDDRSQ